MTSEEKREFEEFLQWKKERATLIKSDKKDSTIPLDQDSKEEAQEEIENGKRNISSTIVWILVIVLLIISVIIRIHNSTSTIQEESYVSSNVVEDNTSTVYAPPTKATWFIITGDDEMTDTKNIWAEITSDNYISQDFPYEGMTRAEITVRYMKKFGYDVLIKITQGQIDGREYYGTDYITARFDEGTPKKYFFNESADGSSNVVFLRNKSDFIKQCKRAKDIKIDVPIYQSGRPVFNFHVDEPLVWPVD